jgi:hypothetical protein
MHNTLTLNEYGNACLILGDKGHKKILLNVETIYFCIGEFQLENYFAGQIYVKMSILEGAFFVLTAQAVFLFFFVQFF